MWCVGIDLGAVHAVNCRLRRPALFAGAIGLSGIYDLARFWGTEATIWCCAALPCCIWQENGIANKLALAKAEENSLMLCAGQGAYEDDAKADTQALADLLKASGPARTSGGLGRRCLPRVVLVGQDAGPVCAADSGK